MKSYAVQAKSISPALDNGPFTLSLTQEDENG